VRAQPARLACTAWALWLLSFVTPDSRARELGGVWLARAPLRGGQLLLHAAAAPQAASWQSIGLGSALLLGFAANFTVLLPPGLPALLLAVALTWLPWLAYLQLWRSGVLGTALPPWALLYFYPWMLGLVLLQLSRLPRVRS
jgi:hypothetical protein